MPSDAGDNPHTTTVKNHHGPPPPPPQEPEHLPCPRCQSTNTKFCYYNNYNFSQPRHFCKTCRRYWTHGGTLRDIPVGGCRRKNAKRSRVSTSASRDDSGSLEFRHVLPSAPAPGFMPFGGGSFMSLLSNAGLFMPDVCGFDRDGRTMWPFAGIGGGGISGGGGGGSTWQSESEEGGGDCFVLPELVSSTLGNAMK
ncbi:hypothetical protein SSX86_016237 [Deinandra increscens subsp. villosa]|uniref:Dof zinc finger protein n=1 Tax=Deinandra increscens subsp. villosa TaxID=3103831 RepID=A0AAP0CXK4_9ASTR